MADRYTDWVNPVAAISNVLVTNSSPKITNEGLVNLWH